MLTQTVLLNYAEEVNDRFITRYNKIYCMITPYFKWISKENIGVIERRCNDMAFISKLA